MPEGNLSHWIAEVKRSWQAKRSDHAELIVNELDQKPALAFLLHLRAFASLVREIISR